MDTNYKRELQRKFIHLSSLWMVGAIWILPAEKTMILFCCLYLFMLCTELLRLYSLNYNKLFNRFFIKILREHETARGKQQFVGAYYVVLAVLLAVVFFTKEIAITAVLVMLISDTFAALIGKKFGKVKLLDKSLEGSLAFLLSGFISVYAVYFLNHQDLVFLVSGLIAVFFATIAELGSRQLKLDDNLTIVLTMGFIMTAANFLLNL